MREKGIVQYQARSERPDDRGQANQVCEPGQHHDEQVGGEYFRFNHVQFAEQANGKTQETRAKKQHAADEQYGEHDSHQDIQQVDTPRDDNVETMESLSSSKIAGPSRSTRMRSMLIRYARLRGVELFHGQKVVPSNAVRHMLTRHADR